MSEQYSEAWRIEVLSRRKDFIVTLLENVCKERDNKDLQIAALTTRLQEAEAIIKPIGDAYVASCGNTPPIDEEEAEEVLYDVFNSITIEVPARAAAWLKGGTE